MNTPTTPTIPDTISPYVADKAARIVEAGLVAHGPGPVGRDYRVKGTSGLYTVTIVSYDEQAERLDAICTCDYPARLCSHVIAAAQFAVINGETLGGDPTPADDGDPFDIR